MKTKNTRAKKIAFIGITSSLALLLSYIEFLLPPIFISIPGIKLGLPNVIILYVLYSIDIKTAVLVSFARIFVSSLLFGNPITILYSISGAVLSLTVMAILKKTDILSEVGVSVAGGITHNLGQILVAMALLNTPQIAYYLIVLAITGTISGVFIGLCGAILIKRIPKHKFLNQ